MTNFMPGYRLHDAARRASIQFSHLPSVVGVDYRYQHRFARERTDGLPLEKSPPVESWGKAAIGGLLMFAVFIPAVYFLLGTL